MILIQGTVKAVDVTFSPFQLCFLQELAELMRQTAQANPQHQDMAYKLNRSWLMAVYDQLAIRLTFHELQDELMGLLVVRSYQLPTTRKNPNGGFFADHLVCPILCSVRFQTGEGAMFVMVHPFVKQALLNLVPAASPVATASPKTEGLTVSLPPNTSTATVTMPPVMPSAMGSPAGLLKPTPSLLFEQTPRENVAAPNRAEQHQARLEAYQRLVNLVNQLKERGFIDSSQINRVLQKALAVDASTLYSLVEAANSTTPDQVLPKLYAGLHLPWLE